jgi:hypothetical protein
LYLTSYFHCLNTWSLFLDISLCALLISRPSYNIYKYFTLLQYANQRLQIKLGLLMISGVPLETCWAFNERWNNKFCYKVASCWLFLLNIHPALSFLFTLFSFIGNLIFAKLITLHSVALMLLWNGSSFLVFVRCIFNLIKRVVKSLILFNHNEI